MTPTVSTSRENLVGIRFDSEAEMYSAIKMYTDRWPHGYLNKYASDIIIIPEQFSYTHHDDLRNHGIVYHQFSVPHRNAPDPRSAIDNDRNKTREAHEALKQYEASVLDKFRSAAEDLTEHGQHLTHLALSVAIRKDRGMIFATTGLHEFVNLVIDDPARQTSANARFLMRLIGDKKQIDRMHLHAVRLYQDIVRILYNQDSRSLNEFNTAELRRRLFNSVENNPSRRVARPDAADLLQEMQALRPTYVPSQSRSNRRLAA